MMPRRQSAGAALAIAALLALGAFSSALQDYPARPIRPIVRAPAGSFGRHAIAQDLGERL
jgi:tripartite-type tricarboxylate transporter receptor subunit TctC